MSALNLSGPLIRPGPPAHSHFNMKQGMDMVQQSHNMKAHESMMNPTWNAQGFTLSQGFHAGNKVGTNPDRGIGSSIGSQRKSSHQVGNMPNMAPVKYMSNPGYSQQVHSNVDIC